MNLPTPGEPLQPRDWALLLLASGDLKPRRRARDQQADLAGLEIQRQILERLVALDPEPADVEAAFMQIVEEIGPPTGPTRSIAVALRDDWHAACAAPEWVAHLLGEALRHSHPGNEDKPRGRRFSS